MLMHMQADGALSPLFGEPSANAMSQPALLSLLIVCPCRRVVHRDLKLENLLLAVPGDISRVKIADFGLAKKVAGTGPAGMQTICGTPHVLGRWAWTLRKGCVGNHMGYM